MRDSDRDTVASVGFLVGRKLPFVSVNTTIKVFRQALALDEVSTSDVTVYLANLLARMEPSSDSVTSPGLVIDEIVFFLLKNHLKLTSDLPCSTDLNFAPNSTIVITTNRISQSRLIQKAPRMRNSRMNQM